MRTTLRNRRCGPPLGRRTKGALYFAMACGFWLTFKQVEPTVFPVIKRFEITEVVDNGDTLTISGTFDKVRECVFIDMQGYSGGTYIAVVFSRYPVISRMARPQTFGPWLLAPKTSQLDLYVRHVCTTGEVTTKIFSGAIVL